MNRISPEEVVTGYRESGFIPISWRLFEREGDSPGGEVTGACAMGAFVYHKFGDVPLYEGIVEALYPFGDDYRCTLATTFNLCVDLTHEPTTDQVRSSFPPKSKGGRYPLIIEGYEDAVGAWRLLQEEYGEGARIETEVLALV